MPALSEFAVTCSRFISLSIIWMMLFVGGCRGSNLTPNPSIDCWLTQYDPLGVSSGPTLRYQDEARWFDDRPADNLLKQYVVEQLRQDINWNLGSQALVLVELLEPTEGFELAKMLVRSASLRTKLECVAVFERHCRQLVVADLNPLLIDQDSMVRYRVLGLLVQQLSCTDSGISREWILRQLEVFASADSEETIRNESRRYLQLLGSPQVPQSFQMLSRFLAEATDLREPRQVERKLRSVTPGQAQLAQLNLPPRAAAWSQCHYAKPED